MPPSRLCRPLIQNLLASIITGLAPGLYASLTILGAGGGPANATQMANIANAVLYGVYFVSGFFSGAMVTTAGPRITMMLGVLGYPLFVGSLWYFSETGCLWFPIAAGALLGLTAALLWTAAGFIAYSYPQESQKGLYISMQWGFFSLGSTAASLVAFGLSYHPPGFQTTSYTCPKSLYVVFIIIMSLAMLIALFGIASPSAVRNPDGSQIRHHEPKGWLSELMAQRAIVRDWKILSLSVPLLGAEVAIIVFSTLNSLYFNIRTRSLNSLIFVLMQTVASPFVSFTLDSSKIGNRRIRGIVAVLSLSVLTLAGWVGLAIWLCQYPDMPVESAVWDWTHPAFPTFCLLNVIFGINMVAYPVIVQWIAAALTNDPQTLARYSGFAKGGLAGGSACAFGVEAARLKQLHTVAFNFTLQGLGLACMATVCVFHVKSTSNANEGIVPVDANDRISEADDKSGRHIGRDLSLDESGSLATRTLVTPHVPGLFGGAAP